MRKNLMVLGVLLLVFTRSIAQEGNDKAEKLDEVVVTAQYIPQSIKKSVYKIRLIDIDEIKALGAANLRDLLYYEMNLDIIQQGSFSGTGVEIQGISQENIKILIDGVPVVGRLKGTIDLNQINLDNIERVEIIEGPTSVYYGTDAMGGVINLITKKDFEENLLATLNSYIETNSFNASGNLNVNQNNQNFNLNLGRNYFNGYTANPEERKTDWGSREQYFADFAYRNNFKKGNFAFESKFFNEELTNLGEPKPDNTAIDYVSDTRRIVNNMHFNNRFSNYDQFMGIASYSNYKRIKKTFVTNLDNNTQELSEKRTDTTFNNTFFIKGQFSHINKEKPLNYSVGVEVSLETIRGARIRDLKQSLNTYAVFASANYDFLKVFSLQPGLRYSYNQTYGSVISPAVHFKYQINESNRILISYANGFRAPSINQLYLNFAVGSFLILGNEDLEPENSDNYMLSSYHELQLFKRDLILETSFYYNDIDNLIALGPLVDFKREYINININKTKGGNIGFTYNPVTALKIKGGFSLLSKYNAFAEKYETEDYILTNRIMASATYDFRKIKTRFNLHYKHNGKELGYYVEKGTGDLVKTELSPFDLLDFNVFRSFFKNKLDVSLGVKNIFNETNLDNNIVSTSELSSRQAFLYGRSYFAKISFKI